MDEIVKLLRQRTASDGMAVDQLLMKIGEALTGEDVAVLRAPAGFKTLHVRSGGAADRDELQQLSSRVLRGKAGPAEEARLTALLDRSEAARLRGAA